MYRYFMGAKSNLREMKPNSPIVIEVKNGVSSMIQKWLDKYGLDFDEWIEGIVAITHSEIKSITLEDTQLYKLELENQQIALIELLLSDEPKCKLNLQENEYIFYIKNGLLMESCIQVINHIHFSADAVENKILIGNKPVFIAINLERFNERLYSCVKKYIDKLESWDMIAKIMEWIYSLPVEIDSYDLTIVSINERLMGMQKVTIDHNRITRYIHINPVGEFQVDYDGTWEAEYNGIKYRFNLLFEKVRVELPRGHVISVMNYFKCFSYVKELIAIMYGTLKTINLGFENIEQQGGS